MAPLDPRRGWPPLRGPEHGLPGLASTALVQASWLDPIDLRALLTPSPGIWTRQRDRRASAGSRRCTLHRLRSRRGLRDGGRPAARLPWTSRDHRPQRLRPPPHPLGVQPARRAGADHRPRRHVGQARVRQPRHHRPRRALRVGRVLPGGHQGGHQADHRRGDLRRPAVDDGQGGQGRQPALPPPAAGDRHDRLPEPVPAGHRRPHRRLLLQAPHRPGAPGEAQPGPGRHVGLPRRRDPQGPRGGRLGAGPQARRRVRRHLRQGPVLPGAAGPRDPRAAPPQRAAAPPGPGDRPAADRHQRPALRAPGAARGARRPAVRRARGATSTRRTGCASRGRTSTSRPRPRCTGSSRTSARRCSTPGASPRWWTSSSPWASCGSRTSRCPTARPSRAGCARSARRASSAATARSPRSSRRAWTTSWA